MNRMRVAINKTVFLELKINYSIDSFKGSKYCVKGGIAVSRKKAI